MAKRPKKAPAVDEATRQNALTEVNTILQGFIDRKVEPGFALTVAVGLLKEVLAQVNEIEGGTAVVKQVAARLCVGLVKVELAPLKLRVKEILENPKVFQ